MKNLVLLVLFVVFPVYLLADQNFLDEFELQRINENYYGVAGNSSNIIIFGDSGDIFRSIDSCKTWEKIHISDAHFIMDIIQSGYLYGVLDNAYVIKSYDNGKTWEKSFIGNYKFHRIKFYQNQLYCLAENKIIVCNTSLEKIKEYDIQIGNINGNPNNTVGDQYDFEIFNDKIYYVSDTTELSEIDIQTNKTRKINLENFGNIIRNDVPSNLFRIKNKLYFTMFKVLYSFSDDKLLLVQKNNQLSIWTSSNNDIFYLNRVFFKFKNRDSISFNKVIPGSNPHKINDNINDRYISNCSFKAIKFLTDDMIIAVGMSKLIYISFNQGKHWMLISQMDNRIYSSIFKGSGNHAMYVSDDVKFVHTSDNGITWKPQKLYSDFFFSKQIYGDLLNYGYATMFNDKGVAFYSQFLTIANGDTNFFVSEQNGDITRFLNNDYLIGYPAETGIAYVKYHFFENNNRLFLTLNSGILQTHWVFSFLFAFNDNMYMTRKNFFDSSHVLIMDTFGDGNIYGLTANYREPKLVEDFKVNLSLIKSTNGGNSFETEANYEFFNHEMKFSSKFINSVSNSKDEIFFYFTDTTGYYIDSITQYKIYGINIHTKKLSEIGRLPKHFDNISLGVQKFNSKYYFTCVNFLPHQILLKLFVNDDPFNNPDNWKEVVNPGYSNLNIEVLNDSTSTIFAYYSLINNYVIWFAKAKNATSVIEGQTEIQTPIYNTTPYPNPARNIIRTKIYWDLRYDINKADISIYDYKGNRINGRQDVDINRLNNYSGILSWDCSKYNSGLYFIMIKLGNSTRSIPVIVNK